MSSWRIVASASLVCSLLIAASAHAATEAPRVSGSCSIEFLGTSTLHDFEGTAPCAVLTIESPDASGRYGARAEVAVTAMKTGISARDKRMREMFDAKRFPTIVAAFSNVDPAALRVQKALPFRITIHGRERQATAVIERFSETDGREAHIVASFDLSLKDFALEAPVAMGFIRVGDLVKVTVSVDLKALPAGSAAPSAR